MSTDGLTENQVQALITERLLAFERALVERGQIRRANPSGPAREDSREYSARCSDCRSVLGPCGADHEEGVRP